jgi:Ca-activated chloride channel family protein
MRRTASASFTVGAIAVALVAAACASASAPSGGAYRPPEQHHQPTQPPPPDQSAATPYDGVTYEDPGVNPYVDTRRDRESTFALDVDTASYGIATRYIADGNLPDPASVRVEEFVNSFDQGYPRLQKTRRLPSLPTADRRHSSTHPSSSCGSGSGPATLRDESVPTRA